MNPDNNTKRIIRKLYKEILPKEIFQQGNSRVYLDDNANRF